MKLLHDILYAEVSDLVKCGISEDYLKVAKSRRSPSWPFIKDPADKRKVLFDVYGLKPATQNLIKQVICGGVDPMKWFSEQLLISRSSTIQASKNDMPERAKEHYKPELYAKLIKEQINGTRISTNDAYQYTLACAWLDFCQSKWYKKAGFSSKKDFLQAVVDHLIVNPIKGLKISNVRYLQRKIQEYNSKQEQAVISGLTGKKSNRQKLGKVQKMFLLDRYSSPLKPTIPILHRMYLDQAQELGWPEVSESTIKTYLFDNSTRQKWALGRHGSDYVKNTMVRRAKRRKASYPDALWSMDGTDVPLLYTDKYGKKMKSSLYIYYIQDVNSDLILGYDIQVGTETAIMVQAALRRAIRYSMKKATEIQYDNSSANRADEVKQLMPKLSRMNIPVKPYNGKSKPVENLIKRHQQGNLRHFDNYRGGNRTSPSQQIKANPDHVSQIQLPNVQQAIDQVHLAIKVFNNTKGKDGKTPVERYQVDHEFRRSVDYLSMVDIFWVKRRKPARYTPDGLIIEVKGEKYTYEVESSTGIEDMDFRMEYLGDRFDIYYDPDDLSAINLYQDGKWISTANQKYEMPQARVDRKAGEGAIVQAHYDQEDTYLDKIDRERQEARASMDEIGVETLSYKHIHKDALNRIEQSEILEELENYRSRPQRKVSLYPVKETGNIIQ